MELSERIIKYYTDVDHGSKKVFLVSGSELEELLGFSKVGDLDLVKVDSQEVADRYTLVKEGHGEIVLSEGTVLPAHWYDRVVVQSGNLYVLDTRAMERPEYFCHMFLPDRYYFERHDTTSAVAVLKEHFDRQRPFSNWTKFSAVIQDLS